MLPSAITLQNYRSFAKHQRFDLRPLTILFGPNSAGKSALLRSLPLLADSLAQKQSTQALSFDQRMRSFELNFESLRWKGRQETDPTTVGFALHYDLGPVSSIEWQVGEEALGPRRRLVTQQFTVLDRSERLLLRALRTPTRGEKRAPQLKYRLERPDQGTQEIPITWNGLLPDLTSVPDLPWWLDCATRLTHLASSVLWLRSLRPAPGRTMRWYGEIEWRLAPDGGDSAIVMFGEPDVKADVASWYATHAKAQLTVEETSPNAVRTIISPSRGSGFKLDLIDTGEGLNQVLPVLTALAMARQREPDEGPSIVAVEEPEAHLHPTLQTELLRRAIDVVTTTPTRVVFETHSLAFLLAAQVEVARVDRRIQPGDVIIYWVRQREDGSSVAEAIELDDLARFRGNWPPDAFAQDLELGAQLQDQRDKRERP